MAGAKKVVCIAILSLGCLAAFAGAAAAPGEPVAIGGRVTEPGGSPLAGAQAELVPYPPSWSGPPLVEEGRRPGAASGGLGVAVARGVTDGAGRFRLTAPEPGAWRVVARARGRVPKVFDLLPLTDAVELPPVALAKVYPWKVRVVGPGGVAVAAAVVRAVPLEDPDAAGGDRPSAGPQALWHSAALRVKSDEAGVAGLRVAGRVQLTVSAAELAPEQLEVAAPPLAPVAVRLHRGRRVVLAVRDADGSPMAGVAAFLPGLGAVAESREDGRLELIIPRGAEMPVRLLAPDGRWAAGTLGGGGKAAAVAGGTPPPQRIFTPEPPELWEGQAVDRGSRRPLAGALVWPSAYPWHLAFTDGRGRFSLPVPFAPPRRVGGTLDGYRPGVVELAPPGRQGTTLPLAPGGRLQGVVRGEVGGAVADAEIEALPAAGAPAGATVFPWARSDGRGRFLLRGLEPERAYRLRVRAPGFAPATFQAAAALVGGPSYEIVLRRGRAAAGRVVAASGQPLAGARVEALPSSFAETAEALLAAGDEVVAATAKGDGRFQLPLLPTGEIDLRVTAPGFAAATVRGVELPPGDGPAEVGTFHLQPGVTLEGQVVSSRGEPLPGSEVEMLAAGKGSPWPGEGAGRGAPRTQTVGGDGRFTFQALAHDEPVRLQARHEGYVAKTVERVPGRKPGRVVLELEPAARIAGRVRDERGEPVAGATVFASHRQAEQGFGGARRRGGATRTDAEGRFTLEALDAGHLRLTVLAEGFLPAVEEVEVAPGGEARELVLTLSVGSVLEGTVRNEGSAPVAGARVQVAGHGVPGGAAMAEPPTATSGEGGAYRLSGVAAGERPVVVEHPDYAPGRRVVQVEAGHNHLDLELRRGAEVAGRVVTEEGAPVAGVRVTLRSTDGGTAPSPTVSGGAGAFAFRTEAPGTYRLLAEKRGYAPASLGEVQVEGAPLRGLELVVSPGATVSGRIFGLASPQLTRLQISAKAAGYPGHAGRMVAGGRYRIDHLAPGEWTVSAHSPSLGRGVSARVEISPHQVEVTLDLEFIEGYTLSGLVHRGGHPVAGALVALRSAGGATGGAVADAAGRFHIEGLAGGEYRLTVVHRGAGTQLARRITLEGDLDLSLDLSNQEPGRGIRPGGER